MTDSFERMQADRLTKWWARLTDYEHGYLIQCADAGVCPPKAARLINGHGLLQGTVTTTITVGKPMSVEELADPTKIAAAFDGQPDETQVAMPPDVLRFIETAKLEKEINNG